MPLQPVQALSLSVARVNILTNVVEEMESET
jgi:hypothetical protein